MRDSDVVDLVNGLRGGRTPAIARLISLAEQGASTAAEALARLQSDRRDIPVIGVTGYPGVGKSTLVSRLAHAYRKEGQRVAIIAVDPSSPLTGGAILGDRIRMQERGDDAGVFIRSMATRGHRGGVARATNAAVQILQAAPFDVVIVETVGVGQEEVGIAEFAKPVILIVTPGLGDDVQAMKSGVLEVADIVVVNKADQPGADRAAAVLGEWVPCVVRTVATIGAGIPDLIQAIRRLRVPVLARAAETI